MSRSDRNDVDAETLEADVDKLRADFALLKGHLGRLGKQTVRRAEASGRAEIDALSGAVEEMIEQLGARGRDKAEALDRQVRDRPLVSVLAAFGMGMVVSRMLSGTRR